MSQSSLESTAKSAPPISQRPLEGESWSVALHPAWFALIRLCRELHHGEIERLVIQDGLPVLAETTRKKVKLI